MVQIILQEAIIGETQQHKLHMMRMDSVKGEASLSIIIIQQLITNTPKITGMMLMYAESAATY